MYSMLRTGIVLRTALAGALYLTPAFSQTPGPPEFVDITPPYSNNQTQTYSVTFRDPNGYTDLGYLYININVLQIPSGGCFIEFNLSTFAFRLLNDAGTSWITGSSTLQNSQCTVNVGSSQVALNGNDARLTFTITASPSFTGKRVVYLNAVDRSANVLDWAAYADWYPGVNGTLVNRYRIFSPASSSHLHTTDLNEYNTLVSQGYIGEGVGSRIFNAPAVGGGILASPIYRLYFKNAMRHFWTIDRNEYLTLLKARTSYTGEGADGFALTTAAAGTIPLYRLSFCCATPTIHHWTTDTNEVVTLQSRGWVQEGVAAWVYPATSGMMSEPGPVSALGIDTVLNAASQQASPLAANQTVRIRGRGFGSEVSSVYASVGQRRLEVTSVRDEEVVAVTPKDLPANETAILEVVVNSARRASTSVTTTHASPGIFTDGPDGLGHALAERGEGRVTVYVTGIGNGALSAWLNGFPAKVISAEPASDLPGVTAVTLAVPPSLEEEHASISLKVGEAYTQPGVSVAIR